MDKKIIIISISTALVILLAGIGFKLFQGSFLNENERNSSLSQISDFLNENNSISSDNNESTETNKDENNNENSPAGLGIEILKQGTGEAAKKGDQITVHYSGKLTDGTKFDSSYDRGIPLQFTLGAGQVISGWDQGILGMRVGEKRKLIIPPEMAYGTAGVGGIIPPKATLIFEIELVQIIN